MKSSQPAIAISLTVSGPNSDLGGAIESVLSQNDFPLELFVIDNASGVPRKALEQWENDDRLSIIRNRESLGSGACLNRFMAESRAPVLVCMTPEHRLFPGALKRLNEEILANATVAQILCLELETTTDGRTTRSDFHRHREGMQKKLSGSKDFRSELLYNGLLVDGLLTYRRRAVETAGGFTGEVIGETGYDMALRLQHKYEIAFVPEALCVRRRNPTNSRWLNYRQKLGVYRRLSRTRGLAYLGETRFGTLAVIIRGFATALDLEAFRGRLRRWFKRHGQLAKWWLLWPASQRFYRSMSRLLRRWRLDTFATIHSSPNLEKRVFYYLWQYPVHSQTFVQREVASLLKHGQSIQVVSEEMSDGGFLPEFQDVLDQNYMMLPKPDKSTIRKLIWRFLKRNPLNLISCYLYIVSQRYHHLKTYKFDRGVFNNALILADLLSAKRAEHIHAPWADNCAFVALIASRLAGIPFSIQARAHDLHRENYRIGLALKFEHARFIVTNTRYNVREIRELLGHKSNPPITRVYNGLNLDRFNPSEKQAASDEPFRILCVARIIEQKGLVCLLHACKALRESGVRFRCEIIGGREDIYMNYYVALKREHKRLGLENEFVFMGPKCFTDVIAAYRAADLFVFPAIIAADGSRDIIPNALLEAMAMALPVVATPVGGIPEMVTEGRNGVLVPPADAIALSAALESLIHDEPLRRTLGENARKVVESRFNAAENFRTFYKLFQYTE